VPASLIRKKFALLRRFPLGGGLILFIFFSTALFAPLIATHNPVSQDLTGTLQAPAWDERGSPRHLLGTDHMGRDILSRLVHGARISLVVGFLSVLLSLVFGTSLGLMAGFFGGRIETVIMRLTDMQLAMPYILMAIAIIGALGPSIRNIIIVLAVCNWATYARLVRGEVLSVKQNEFVELALVSGAHTLRILFLHILPNVVNTLIVMATLDLGRMIVFEGALSFLGLGVQPPTASWGNMLADGRAYMTVAWHLATLPGLCIMLVVLGTNLFGDWLRDILDPKRKKHMAGGQ
jgi:peptide/nickel transport system permease protein